MLDSSRIKEFAAEVGFDLCAITDSSFIAEARTAYFEWLSAGYQAEMTYLSKNPDRRTDPELVLPEAKSLIMLGLNYFTPDYHKETPVGHGRISKYARGKDYHKVMERKLKALTALIESETETEDDNGQSPKIKWYVDYGPILERAHAAKGGLGYIGKNSMLINRQFGSWFFLGAMITDLALEADDQAAINHGKCGSCTRCIDACPTGAIIADGKIDSNRCISYLTIERPTEIPSVLSKQISPHLFGCDICQDVCPHNGRAVQTLHREFLPESGVGESLDLEELFKIESQDEFLKLAAGTPLTRPKLEGLKRVARILLGQTDSDTDTKSAKDS